MYIFYTLQWIVFESRTCSYLVTMSFSPVFTDFPLILMSLLSSRPISSYSLCPSPHFHPSLFSTPVSSSISPSLPFLHHSHNPIRAFRRVHACKSISQWYLHVNSSSQIFTIVPCEETSNKGRDDLHFVNTITPNITTYHSETHER